MLLEAETTENATRFTEVYAEVTEKGSYASFLFMWLVDSLRALCKTL